MSREDPDNGDTMVLPCGGGHENRRADFFCGSVITIIELSQVGGLGLTIESDIVHGPSAFVSTRRGVEL